MMVLKMFFETIFIHIGTFSPVLLIKKTMKCLVDVISTNEALTHLIFNLPDRYTDSKVGKKSLGLGKMSVL